MFEGLPSGHHPHCFPSQPKLLPSFISSLARGEGASVAIWILDLGNGLAVMFPSRLCTILGYPSTHA